MGMLKDFFFGAGSRYDDAVKKYQNAATQASDWNKIKNNASNYAANANANTRDSVYKQARSFGYGKGLAMQKAKQAANESASQNYERGMNAAANQADRQLGVASNVANLRQQATGSQIASNQQAFSNLLNTGASAAYILGGGSAGTLAKKFLNL